MKTVVFENGAVRLKDRYRHHQINLTADIACDDLTRLAAAVAQTPVALLCLIDAEGVRISSQVGLESAAVDDWCGGYRILRSSLNLGWVGSFTLTRQIRRHGS